mmetsp:Transcript_26837/g.37796  ORF Transcript_26837/g.37796 Transcript_26837/m.37796 type:complete len:142 (+) Transcript_26837:231-656(+)
MDITYTYWDGSTGHRRVMKIKKGTSMNGFLERVKYEFRDLRSVPVDGLMFVKQDLIVPGHLTFYDLMLTEARGKSGSLFLFEAPEEVKHEKILQHKDESHIAKVVVKTWYEKNKLNYPASKWEVFDPFAATSKYTIPTKQF